MDWKSIERDGYPTDETPWYFLWGPTYREVFIAEFGTNGDWWRGFYCSGGSIDDATHWAAVALPPPPEEP